MAAKNYILVVLIFLSTFGRAQPKWKSFEISTSTKDTINRVDMMGKKQGPWVEHIKELRGSLGYDEQGYYTAGSKEGRWVRFSLQGDKIAEENYHWNYKSGKCLYYSRAGILEREENWRAIDPKKQFDTVAVMDLENPNKVLRYQVVKVETHSLPHGVWKYYDIRSGKMEGKEHYWMGKLREEAEEGISEVADGEPKKLPKYNKDSIQKTQITKPAVVQQFEKQNSGKKRKKREGETGL